MRNPPCVRCGEPATILDHRIPHKGNPALFWAEANWQALCQRCHNSKTGRESRALGDDRLGGVGGSENFQGSSGEALAPKIFAKPE
jgi:hypothetical protein